MNTEWQSPTKMSWAGNALQLPHWNKGSPSERASSRVSLLQPQASSRKQNRYKTVHSLLAAELLLNLRHVDVGPSVWPSHICHMHHAPHLRKPLLPLDVIRHIILAARVGRFANPLSGGTGFKP